MLFYFECAWHGGAVEVEVNIIGEFRRATLYDPPEAPEVEIVAVYDMDGNDVGDLPHWLKSEDVDRHVWENMKYMGDY